MTKAMAKNRLKSPDLYINRELGWLEFNDRVLQEGLSDHLPLLERLKFLAIVSSNLDEFFLVRVAGLAQQRAAGVRSTDPAGLNPAEQLKHISQRAHRMVAEQTAGIHEVLNELSTHGLHLLPRSEWTEQQKRYLDAHFIRQILPILTPLALEDLNPIPLLPSLQLHVAAMLAIEEEGQTKEKIVAVPVPSQLPRFIDVSSDGEVYLAQQEDVIAANLPALFPGAEVLATACFRIIRDADVTVIDDDAGDLLQVIEEAVVDRRRRAAVRLSISAHADQRIETWLTDWLGLQDDDVFEIEGLLDASSLWEIVGRPGFDDLKIPDWTPQPPRDLLGTEDLWEAIQDRDVLLFHPYESFDPVVQFVERASEDPDVLAIKQTLYRTSGDSPIIRALEQAAENGKEVTVLVELKARFDEARNVNWARRLEDAGCHVIYGVAGFKTHAKALLIVRRESQRIRRYVHLATGNYNDKTAKLYSDMGLMTSNRDIAADVAAFFNLLTGYSETVGWSKLVIAPTRIEATFHRLDRPGNPSLDTRPAGPDHGQGQLAARSRHHPGLVSGEPGRGENHAQHPRPLLPAARGGRRVGKHRGHLDHRPLPGTRADLLLPQRRARERCICSSADWMRRNLEKRLEIMFPIIDPGVRRRAISILNTFFADNVQARRLRSDGTYERVPTKGQRIRAQETFYKDAVEAVRTAEKASLQFRPLTKPKD